MNKKEGDMEGLWYLDRLHRILLGFNPSFFFFLIFLNLEVKSYGTRKRIKFWTERLIGNSNGNSKQSPLVLGRLSFISRIEYYWP